MRLHKLLNLTGQPFSTIQCSLPFNVTKKSVRSESVLRNFSAACESASFVDKIMICIFFPDEV